MIQLHRFRTNVSECINCVEWHNEDFGVGTGVNDCDLVIVLIDYVWLYFVFALIFLVLSGDGNFVMCNAI